METILFLAPTADDGGLPKGSTEALATAIALRDARPGARLAVGLWGGNVQPAADAVAGCGAEVFLAATGDALAPSRGATDAAAATALVERAGGTFVVAPGGSRVQRCLPIAAARTGGRLEPGVTGFSVEGDAVRVRRWIYRQRILATLGRTARPWFWTVDAGACAPWSGAAGTAALEAVPVACGEAATRTRVVGIEEPPADARTIRPDAPLLLVAGAGWTKRQADGMAHADDAARLIQGFLAATDASLGSSKSLVDQSGEGHDVLPFLTHLHQVGQTGSTPRHAKGLATCCHGEEPHVVGWRFVRDRRAVNLDPNCGWARGKADVLYVADAFAVMERVNARLAQGASVAPGGA